MNRRARYFKPSEKKNEGWKKSQPSKNDKTIIDYASSATTSKGISTDTSLWSFTVAV